MTFKIAFDILKKLNLKTIRFNFKYFPFAKAVLFPVFVSKNVVLKEIAGSVVLPEKIHTGIIKLGFGDVGIFDKKGSKSIWEVKGHVEFKGATNIGHGSKICVGEKGNLCFGEQFHITAESSIVCFKEIHFGNNCLLSWEILIMDTDFHKVFKNEKYVNPDNSIIISDNVWIGARSTILKGSSILSGSIVAAGSLVNKRFEQADVVIAGSPARIINENVKWKI